MAEAEAMVAGMLDRAVMTLAKAKRPMTVLSVLKSITEWREYVEEVPTGVLMSALARALEAHPKVGSIPSHHSQPNVTYYHIARSEEVLAARANEVAKLSEALERRVERDREMLTHWAALGPEVDVVMRGVADPRIRLTVAGREYFLRDMDGVWTILDAIEEAA
jgi:hypothetical protein